MITVSTEAPVAVEVEAADPEVTVIVVIEFGAFEVGV